MLKQRQVIAPGRTSEIDSAGGNIDAKEPCPNWLIAVALLRSGKQWVSTLPINAAIKMIQRNNQNHPASYFPPDSPENKDQKGINPA
ncbi:hypothetical protein [Pseudomonas palleroniana]|nr:hypothetical protein [Pseudomonas palleroniana]SEE87008.1 hypothetical protein SAMN04490198_3237 [Pseudomonas palleroniana]